MPEWLNSEIGQNLFKEAFKMAGLPEVKEEDLGVGIYTNQQIAEKCENATRLIVKIINLLDITDPVIKRAILSSWVDGL